MREKLEAWCEKLKEELTGKKSHKLIREVIEYVQNYYDQEITLAEIADSLFVNRNYLSQLFKKVTGETFVTYLNTYRIEKAKEKLKEKNYLVYEISEMVGYQNPTYFSQVFKSITGRTPSEYYK
nr:helix-turn-helix domain-containing protein [Bacillus sp. FJAT-50079]